MSYRCHGFGFITNLPLVRLMVVIVLHPIDNTTTMLLRARIAILAGLLIGCGFSLGAALLAILLNFLFILRFIAVPNPVVSTTIETFSLLFILDLCFESTIPTFGTKSCPEPGLRHRGILLLSQVEYLIVRKVGVSGCPSCR